MKYKHFKWTHAGVFIVDFEHIQYNIKLILASIYLFKVNDRSPRIWEFFIFIVNFEQISHIALVLPLLRLVV